MNAPAPLVSVILPTRNRAALLLRAVASVLAQTHSRLELIVVNDASSDETPAVLARIDDPRLRVIHRDVNRGAAAARNAGLAAAHGELVAFQDDDDRWLIEKLAKQVAALQAAPAEVGWCLCGNIRLKSVGARYIGGDFFIRQLDYSHGIGAGGNGPDWGLIATPGWLVKREMVDQVGGFDERIRSWDDWELGLRLSKVCKMIVIDEPLWVQDWILGAGLTKAELARAKDMRIIMEKHGHMWSGQRDVLARHYYMIGRGESLHESPAVGRIELLRSLRLQPLRAQTWAAVAFSYLGRDFMRALTFGMRRLRERIQ